MGLGSMGEYRFAIRVKPGARRDAVGGRWDGPTGPALVVVVSAPAVEGKANEAVRRALAAALDLRPRDIAVISGSRGRDKMVCVRASPPDLATRVARLRDG